MAKKRAFVSEEVVENTVRLARRTTFLSLGMLVVCGIMAIAFLIVAFSLSSKRTLLTVLSPTGQPAVTIAVPDGMYVSEVQAFTREVFAKIFTFNYGDFLDEASQNRWLMSIRPYFTKQYFPRFVDGLRASGFFQAAVQRRVAVFSEVVSPVRVTPLGKGKAEVIFNLVRMETTAEGSVKRLITYRAIIVKGGRTARNPWGLYIDLLLEQGSKPLGSY